MTSLQTERENGSSLSHVDVFLNRSTFTEINRSISRSSSAARCMPHIPVTCSSVPSYITTSKALKLTYHPVHWIKIYLSLAVKGRGMKLSTHPRPVP
jgi:hypothetical protein